MILVISSCSKRKDDSVTISPNFPIIEPHEYISDDTLVEKLIMTRERVFKDPKINSGHKSTYAFEMYFRGGKAYHTLYKKYYKDIKEKILKREIEWFFLSGCYGIVHALESVKKYDATFNYSIAKKHNIPYTKPIWKDLLTLIIDNVLSTFQPEGVYVFGSRDYTWFVKNTKYFTNNSKNVFIFESRGMGGLYWLSNKISEFVSAIIGKDLEEFLRNV